MMCSGVKQNCDFTVRVGNSVIQPSKELNLLGITYDSNLTTAPYLNQLATDAKTRATIIKQLSYSVPPHLLRTFTNGLLIGKIMASAPDTSIGINPIAFRFLTTAKIRINRTEAVL